MRRLFACLFGLIAGLSAVIPNATAADRFVIAIMQDQTGEAEKYKPLINILAKKGGGCLFYGNTELQGSSTALRPMGR
jgi:hypothetical protein